MSTVRLSLLIPAIILLFGAARPVFSQGLTLVGTLDNKHGESSPGSGNHYAGCWGYVGPDGREYALLTTSTGCLANR